MKNLLTLILSMLIGFSTLATTPTDTIKVGTYESTPFSFKIDGKWDGPVHDLWDKLDLGNHHYEFVEYQHSDLMEMLDDVSRGRIDLAVGPITMSSTREDTLNFTTPYYSTELGVVYKEKSSGLLSDMYRLFTSQDFYTWLLMLFILWVVVGVIFWLIEAKTNPDFNANNSINGIGQSIYYAIVVMTTVGFGDKTTKTSAGRAVTAIWMFVSLVITGIFIGNVSSNFTVNRLNFELNSFNELKQYKVGTLFGTNAEDYLYDNGFDVDKRTTNLKDLFTAMDNDEIDVIVYDAAILNHYVDNWSNNNYGVYTDNYNPQFYSFAVNNNKTNLLEELNQKIIKSHESGSWSAIKRKYNIK